MKIPLFISLFMCAIALGAEPSKKCRECLANYQRCLTSTVYNEERNPPTLPASASEKPGRPMDNPSDAVKAEKRRPQGMQTTKSSIQAADLISFQDNCRKELDECATRNKCKGKK